MILVMIAKEGTQAVTESNRRTVSASSPVISGVVQVGPFLLCKLDVLGTTAGWIPRVVFSRRQGDNYRSMISSHIGNLCLAVNMVPMPDLDCDHYQPVI